MSIDFISNFLKGLVNDEKETKLLNSGGGRGKTDSKEVKLEFSAFLKCGEDLNARGLINYIIKTVHFHVVNFLNDVIDRWMETSDILGNPIGGSLYSC